MLVYMAWFTAPSGGCTYPTVVGVDQPPLWPQWEKPWVIQLVRSLVHRNFGSHVREPMGNCVNLAISVLHCNFIITISNARSYDNENKKTLYVTPELPIYISLSLEYIFINQIKIILVLWCMSLCLNNFPDFKIKHDITLRPVKCYISELIERAG